MSASALVRSRCEVHPEREAAARCAGCSVYYCRECVTEHDGRMLCTTCLRMASGPVSEGRPRQVRVPDSVWLTLRAGLGLLLLWGLFAVVGVFILKMPAEFHDGSIWSPEAWFE